MTAVAIPGNPIRSFDISWVNPDRNEYYLGERSNAGIVVIDTRTLTWKRTIGGFQGIKPNTTPTTPVNNNISGPDGVTSHGRWLYAGDGDSTLKVIDLDASSTPIKQSIPTGGTTRVDEMALTTDGELLLAANNAEDPPFATLFQANGDRGSSNVTIFTRVTADASIIPPGAGLSMEQPTWEPKTKRFYVSIPQIANNPAGCTFGGPVFCQGGMAVIDPAQLTAGTATIGAYNSTTNTGVIALSDCGPNGITVGPHSNMMLGCTPQNVPTNTTTQVINAVTHNFVEVGGLTGSDEVWYNSGDNRYYTGSSRACGKAAGCNPPAGSRAPAGAALGVVDAKTNFLVEKIPASSNSHSVAADSRRNLIFVPQVAPNTVVTGGDSTDVGAGVCGTNNGCVAVYSHQVDRDRDDHDRDDHDRDRDDHDHDR